MPDSVQFNCWYQGGRVLRNLSVCPLELDGEPLQYTETVVVEDVVSKSFPYWLLLVVLLMAVDNARKN